MSVEKVKIASGDHGVQGFLGTPIGTGAVEKPMTEGEIKAIGERNPEEVGAEEALAKIVSKKETKPESIVGKGEPVAEQVIAAPKSKKEKIDKKDSKAVKMKCLACDYEFVVKRKDLKKGIVKCPYCGISSSLKEASPEKKDAVPGVVNIEHKMYSCKFCNIRWLEKFGEDCPRCGRKSDDLYVDKAPIARI